MQSVNLAALMVSQCTDRDQQLALVIPPSVGDFTSASSITYGQLRRRIAQLQRGLARLGLVPGDRVVMLSPLGPDFFALALALLASGQVLVFLDGRLDRKRALAVLRAARPRAIVSVRQVLRLWPLLPVLWGTKRIITDAATSGTALGTTPLEALMIEGPDMPEVALQPPDRSALLSFTSGTTGRPKGADRTHGILLAQHNALAGHAPDRAGEIDMPCFPAVVLHNLSVGLTTVLPPIDLRQPGAADPARVLAAIRHFGVNSMSGAPAFMARLASHLDPSPHEGMRRVLIGGAPVSRALGRGLLRAFPGACAEAVYGSTEAEPMTSVTLEELVATPGHGYLVGRRAPVADLRLVELPEIAPPLGVSGLDPFTVPTGQDGEVLVRGPHVNQTYVGDDEAVRRFKVRDPDGSLWHRTVDVARLDPEGRYWLTGRVPDRVTHRGRVLQPFIVEAQLSEQLPDRVALVAHAGAPEGELVVEGARSVADVRHALDALGLPDLPVRTVASIPVDARHNSKIDRPALRALLAAPSQKALP